MKMIFRIIFIIIIISLNSCIALQIPIPRGENDTLVVVAKLVIETRYSKSTHLTYNIEIVMENVKTRKEEKISITNISKHYEYLKSVPPGKYLIKKMISRRGWESKRAFHRYLEVEPGKMTVFPYKFVIKLDEKYYYYSIIEIKKENMDKITAILSKEKNYKLWKMKS